MPTCDVNVDYSPAVWTTAGMDDFLMSYARTQNIYQTSSGFMAKLMNLLNWKDYVSFSLADYLGAVLIQYFQDCDGPLAADASKCVDSVNTAAQPCANWLNRQADLYFTYMDQIYKV
jgi:hypothetical protein